MTNENFDKKNEKKRHTYSREFVQSMFDSIAHRYDVLNHILSGGVDLLWRKRAVRLLLAASPERILDVATGTGDLAIEIATSNNSFVVGMDISAKMLSRANEKIQKKRLQQLITLVEGRAEDIPFASDSFDAVTVAFGVRNFENLELGLREMYRVLKNGGTVVILEFSQPRHFLVKLVYNFYGKIVIPFLGALISRNKSAYTYLPKTISEFPYGEEFCSILRSAGFREVTEFPQTFGITTLYSAKKESDVL